MGKVYFVQDINSETFAFVIPCFNEEHRFDIEHWSQLLGTVKARFTFIDDGSTDGTYELLESLRSHHLSVDLLKLVRNKGKAEAIRFGLMESLSRNPGLTWVGFLDSDTSIDIRDVERIVDIAAKSNCDVVIGSRVKLLGRKISRNPARHLVGRIIASILSWGIADFPYDSQCGFKVFRVSRGLVVALQDPFRTRWFVDLELILRLRTRSGVEIWEEPLHQWFESKGSKIKQKHYLQILRELIYIKRRLRKNWI